MTLLPCPTCEAPVGKRTVGTATVHITCSNPNCDYVYSAEELHNENVRLRHALRMKVQSSAIECTLETELKPEAQDEAGPDNQESPKQP